MTCCKNSSAITMTSWNYHVLSSGTTTTNIQSRILSEEGYAFNSIVLEGFLRVSPYRQDYQLRCVLCPAGQIKFVFHQNTSTYSEHKSIQYLSSREYQTTHYIVIHSIFTQNCMFRFPTVSISSGSNQCRNLQI